MSAVVLLDSVAELRAWRAMEMAAGRSVGFVPTMGGLHEGHASLVRTSSHSHQSTVVSIFVNPLQFGPNEDYSKYPRTFDADLEVCRVSGATAVFVPDAADVYPTGFQTKVIPGDLAEVLCGKSRPGHFTGVTTIVAKLFNMVQPDRAYFGRKDFQQATIIRRMVRDLNMPLEVVVCATVREPDGLAMSTRNRYLSPEARKSAICLWRALGEMRRMYADGERRGAVLVEAGARVIQNAPEARIDYVSLVDPETLRDVTVVQGNSVVCLAVYVGSARLIDNGDLGAVHSP